MAFNIIAETTKRLDYKKIHASIFSSDLDFELVPMPGLGINNGDAIGICIPMNNATESTWEQLKPVLKVLRSKFGCDVYDLYGGQKLGLFNINSFKENLLQ
ncbi:hypothetical protein GFS24_26925 [Chitinophaga sp. SYP-B3965]|uniref:hypothetical protein n=1 Tax=Chitinophaga sp. SYP-B3965 TaxID=2663120 RepID=UPI001299ADF9|nr:hypothetical protein [Chitinophaga sp. SYP-B3965]MRG48772.1 hypothetical protein [Chitinophaga sp. SYP-B3965]